MSKGRAKPKSANASEVPADQSGTSLRRVVEIRCGFAEMTRTEAEAAESRAVEARRLFDKQSIAIAALEAAADPAAIKAAKERAHGAFRASAAAARSKTQVERAASTWLAEVNRVNAEQRTALVRLDGDREALGDLLAQADRLADAAESARAMATIAADACSAARKELADSGEADSESPEAAPPVQGEPEAEGRAARSSAASVAPTEQPWLPTQAQAPAAALATGQQLVQLKAIRPQAIVRLLRRDGRTVAALAESLSSNEASVRSRWQLILSNFVDAVVGAAIDEAWFEFPAGNRFWDLFRPEEAREVARGLAALGFRYDGFGVFANGRVPGQRDLALAVGSAGLLPVRIKFWPNAQEIADLYRTVRVASDAFVAANAPTLSLGELVNLLGRRSEALADLWNEWPRVRELLLSAD